MSIREQMEIAQRNTLQSLLKEKLDIDVCVDAVPFGVEGIWFTVWGDHTPYLAVASDCRVCGKEKAAHGSGSFLGESVQKNLYVLAQEVKEAEMWGGFTCIPCIRRINGYDNPRNRDDWQDDEVPDPSPELSPSWAE